MAEKVVSFEKPREVTIQLGRWEARIRVVDDEGLTHLYVASADHGLTMGDGIFFGTIEEAREAESRV